VNVTLRQLRAFAALSRLGSFTRTAEALHTTQPALSAQIRELEGALDVRLFDRSTRSVALTSTGRDLLPIVERTLSDLEDVIAHAKGVAERSIGRVAVASVPFVAASFMAQTIADFRARHPGIVVALHDALTGGVADRVRDGTVDFGISGAIVGDPDLVFESLGTDRMLAVMPPGHRLARVRNLRLAQVLTGPLILMHSDSSVRVFVDRAAAALGYVAAPAYEPAYMATAAGLVRAGLGVTLLPASTAGAAELSDLALRPLREPELSRPLGLLRRAGRSLSPAAEAFAAYTRQQFAPWLERSHKPRRVPGRVRKS
jgi:DNA-binding transcriptional LysR family regulator